MWETRHGFPRAERLPSGHRRYPREAEVERVLEVVARARRRPLAGRRGRAVRRRAGRGPETSIYAGLRSRRPDLQPYPIPKRLLVAVSHAIEDECSARGERALLLGSFQRERFYREAEPRWREFARTAELAHRAGRLRAAGRAAGRPARGADRAATTRSRASGRSSATRPGFAACLAGRERQVTGERVFEMLWSVEPEVVREAARIGLDLAIARMPELAERVPRAPVAAARRRIGEPWQRHLRHQPDAGLRGGRGSVT